MTTDEADDDEALPSEDDYLLRLGRTVQRVRKKLLGVDQAELGRRIGRDKNTISRWENGKTSLSAFNLAQLWEALGVPGDWLLDPTESVVELDRRIERLRGEQLARASLEASQDDAGGSPGRQGDGGAAGRLGRWTA